MSVTRGGRAGARYVEGSGGPGPAAAGAAARDWLRPAEQAARRSGLAGQVVIDADVHHIDVLDHLVPFMAERWQRAVRAAPPDQVLPSSIGDRRMGGRLKRPPIPPYDDGRPPAPVRDLVATMGRLGIDCSVMFPNDLLTLGLHPDARFEVAVARAYARWLVDAVLPFEPRVRGLLYLPLSDPAASLGLIETYGSACGVAGCLVTATRRQQLDRDEYLPIYAALEERGLCLSFHAAGSAWPMHTYRVLDSYLAAGALSFPYDTAVALAQVVTGGVAERFPGLRLVFVECGLAWLPMMMARLDTAYRMRSSEAPLLRAMPSDYIRRCYFGLQPVEHPGNLLQARSLFRLVGCGQILFASDFPHRDFDLPSAAADLGFLTPEEKRGILCDNAVRAFGLDPATLTVWGAGEA